jgi:DNA-binding NarL/FixJ family response regulator
MRVVLVGRENDRARLRSRLDGYSPGIDIVGEFTTLAIARAAVDAGEPGEIDALLLAPDRPRDDDDPLIEPLTVRELQVLERLAEGFSNKAIAAQLGISVQTVKFHVAAITGKLGVTNRTEAVRQALRRGLVAL